MRYSPDPLICLASDPPSHLPGEEAGQVMENMKTVFARRSSKGEGDTLVAEHFPSPAIPGLRMTSLLRCLQRPYV